MAEMQDSKALACIDMTISGTREFRTLPWSGDEVIQMLTDLREFVIFDLKRESNDSGTTPRTGDATDTRHDGSLEQ